MRGTNNDELYTQSSNQHKSGDSTTKDLLRIIESIGNEPNREMHVKKSLDNSSDTQEDNSVLGNNKESTTDSYMQIEEVEINSETKKPEEREISTEYESTEKAKQPLNKGAFTEDTYESGPKIILRSLTMPT